ncbi:MAG TPA: hypothetical protein VN969_24900 [Streptosporangiaceae bacterium]|jgi:hypothetical protein|nr:hypothetical protein [Streptosporangiaceae bacterium]
MDPDLAALAATGGNALVSAMATDAWRAARDAVARLFSRHAEERKSAVEAQLDGNQSLVTRAGQQDQARAALVPLWEMELSLLLTEHPGAAADLRRLIDEIRSALPGPEQSWTQTNIATSGSRLFAAQGGNVVVHEGGPALPGSADSAGEGDART